LEPSKSPFLLSGPDDHGYLTIQEFGHDSSQAFVFAAGRAVFDRDVLPFDKTGIKQPLAERGYESAGCLSCIDKADHWGVLLRTRRERPRRRSAKKVNELTSPHIRTQAQGTALYRLKRVL
jgi:hypothetical protein